MKLLNTNCHSAFEFQLNDGQRPPMITYQQITSDVLVLKVPDWQEEHWMEVLQKQPDYGVSFKDMTMSPVLEANGFSQLSFRFILR